MGQIRLEIFAVKHSRISSQNQLNRTHSMIMLNQYQDASSLHAITHSQDDVVGQCFIISL